MTVRLIGIAAVLLAGFVPVASAQQRTPGPGPGAAAPASSGEIAQVDVSRLPIDIERIHKQLRQTTVREMHDGLNLRYLIEVYGQSPEITFFTREDNLLGGPVPYGAPTHSEILQHITPQEFRAPVADFGALARWLAGRKDRDK